MAHLYCLDVTETQQNYISTHLILQRCSHKATTVEDAVDAFAFHISEQFSVNMTFCIILDPYPLICFDYILVPN